ncbi:MAG TPA: hypothetical protein VG722_01530, partial [Tepidisphaeraceae bacterium]|nr:hypothetical protein [Tepidisphaeraceae bacterium]
SILSTSGSGNSITVTYSFSAEGGVFNTAANGTYTLSLPAGGFSDAAGNGVAAATLGTFTLNVDTIAPTASLTPVTPPTADQNTVDFTVTYSDTGGSGLNAATIGNAVVSVAGPNGYSQNAVLLSVSGGQAVYEISAPSGFFSNNDNGTYQISLSGGAVSDNAGNSIAAENLGSFTVDLSPPPPAPDITGTVTAPTTAVTPDSKKNLFTVDFANTGNELLNAKTPVVVYASLTPDYDPSTAIAIDSFTKHLHLKTNQSKLLKLKFKAPDTISDGDYYLVTVVDPNHTIPEQHSGNNVFVSSDTVHFEEPKIDLAVGFSSVPNYVVAGNKKGVVKITITNTTASTVDLRGPIDVSLYTSSDDSTIDQLLYTATKNFHLKVGQSKTITFKLKSTGAATDYLVATAQFQGTPADDNSANDTAFSGVAVTFA